MKLIEFCGFIFSSDDRKILRYITETVQKGTTGDQLTKMVSFGKVFQIELYKVQNMERVLRYKGLADAVRIMYRLFVPDSYMAERTTTGTETKAAIEPSLFNAIYCNTLTIFS